MVRGGPVVDGSESEGVLTGIEPLLAGVEGEARNVAVYDSLRRLAGYHIIRIFYVNFEKHWGKNTPLKNFFLF